WYAVLDADEANLTVALRWAEEAGDTESLLRLATGLWQYRLARGAVEDGRLWLERGLAADPPASPPTRASALWGLAWLAYQQGDDATAAKAADDLHRLASEVGDPVARRNAATVTGMVALARDSTEAATRDLTNALELAEQLDSAWLLATSKLNLGIASIAARDLSRAESLIADALKGYEALGDARFHARCLGYLGLTALVRGDAPRGLAVFRLSLSGFDALGEPSGIAEALTGLAAVAAALGVGERAAQLAGAAERLREPFALRPLPVERRITDELLQGARDRMSSARWADAWTQGRALRLEEAVSLGGDFA
ncbi:MAG: hypothetical protein JOZ82_02630, partial [Marmoricola sp.]|nr:hypothetical protein [Marmoricola sp.]